MYGTKGTGFAADVYQNIKYSSDIGTQQFWKGTGSQKLLFYWMPTGKYQRHSQSSI
jgi:hypothetical protein